MKILLRKKKKFFKKEKKKNKVGKAPKKYDSKNGENDAINYHTSENILIREFADIDPEKEETFGETRKYSLRHRLPTSRHQFGERVIYFFDKNNLFTLRGAEHTETQFPKGKIL